ncbi:MAG: hypothetical protein OEQ18_05160 [Gammaproteobacteria bacterium]|nr:hypothetical protein [Gammaproteobacteria bacterium]
MGTSVLSAPLAGAAQTSAPLPFFPFSTAAQNGPAPKPVFPWFAPSQQAPRAAAGFALPWSQSQHNNPYARGGFNPFNAFPSGGGAFNPFASPSPGFNPFAMGARSGAPALSSGLGMVAAPMMQGAAGMLAPFAVNYMIASMNPTTLSTFFGLMTQPTTFGFGGFNPIGFGNPMGFGGAPQPTFPFVPPQQRNATPSFPFMPPPRRQQIHQPAQAPSFPFKPFGLVGK